MGRAIRRLVSLYDSLDDLLQAADNHNSEQDEETDDEVEFLTEEALEKKQEYVCIYYFFSMAFSQVSPDFRSESQFSAFKILIQVLPSVRKAIEDPSTDIDTYLMQVC